MSDKKTVEINKSTLSGFLIVLVLLIIYIYWFHVYRMKVNSVFLEDANFRTGDLILFRTTQNFNSLKMVNYFTHCGVVVEIDGVPFLFEANGVEHMNLLDHHNHRGVFLSPVRERIQKYKGYCYWKRLEHPLNQEQIDNLKRFVTYALENFYYDTNISTVALKNVLGLRKCDANTNCAELCFMALLVLGLIDLSEYDKRRLHYLKYVCNIEELKNNRFLPLLQIVDHPFAY